MSSERGRLPRCGGRGRRYSRIQNIYELKLLLYIVRSVCMASQEAGLRTEIDRWKERKRESSSLLIR